MASPAFVEEVFTWKLIGCCTWFAGLALLSLSTVLITTNAVGLTQSSFLSGFGALITAFLVFIAQRSLLSAAIVPPPKQRWLVNQGWLSTFISRAFLRYRTLASLVQAALFYSSCVTSGIAGVAALSSSTAGSSWKWTSFLGSVLGVGYALSYLLRSGHVLRYPILQRWRYFRIKQRLLPCARQAVITGSAAVAAALVLSLLPRLPSAPSLSALPPQWVAAVLMAWLWQLCAEVLQVVFTEHVQMSYADDPDAVGPLVAAMRRSSNPILQDWALLDLTYLAEERVPGGGRRRSVFNPEAGCPGWRELGSFCLSQLEDVSGALKQALPSIAGAAKHSAAQEGNRAWNVRRVVAPSQGASDKHALAAWHLEALQQRVSWAVRALAALSAASLHEDSLGTLLQDQPGLGDVLLVLLDLQLVLQQYMKTVLPFARRQPTLASSIARMLGRPHINGQQRGSAGLDAAAAALLDNVRVAIYQLVATFEGLQGVLDKASRQPVSSRPADVRAALAAFIAERQ